MQYIDLIILLALTIIIFGVFYYILHRSSKVDKKATISIPTKIEIKKQEQKIKKEIIDQVKSFHGKIWELFSKNDIQGLSPLLSTKMYNIFYDEVKENQKQKIANHIEIESYKKVEITKTNFTPDTAKINVKIISNQIRFTLNSQNKIIKRNKKDQLQLEENWILQRQIKDTSWQLKEIL